MIKVKSSSIDIALLILTIVPISIIPHMVEVFTRYFVTVYFLIKYSNNLWRNKFLVILIVSYTFILSYSTYTNTNSYTWTLSAFMTGMQYLAMFILFYSVTKKNGIDNLARVIVRVLGVLILLNDLILPISRFNVGILGTNYLLGNKFYVSYLHCLFGATAYVLQRGKLNKRILVIWFVYSMLISLALQCATGIIIATVMILLIWLPGILQRLMVFSLMFPIALGVENVLIWGSTNIFKQPWMQKIITDVFHRATNMTGRERLYNITLKLVLEKPLFGYGHVTNIYRDTVGYGNAQNGLFHIVTQAGIIGAVVYFGMITFALQNKKNDNKMYGLYMFLYAMLIGSAVEINLAEIFLVAVAMIYAYQRCQPQNDFIRRITIN